MVKTHSFPRALRLLTPSDFNAVFSDATRIGSPHLTLIARKNQFSNPRLGFAIAKKQIKQAHERNRLKRIMRETFRLNQNQLLPFDFVLLARTSAQQLSNFELRQLMNQLITRAIKKQTSFYV